MAETAPQTPDADSAPDADVVATLQRANRRPGRWIAAGLGVVALGSILTWWFWPTQAADGDWRTTAPSRGTLTLTVTAVGKLEPVDSVEVGSDLSGRVETVAVRANDPVSAGQELARLDPEPFDNAIDQARAQVASANASLTQAQANLTSAQRDASQLGRLVQEGAAARTELERAEIAVEVGLADVATARAQLTQARTALDQAQDNLRDSVITTPIDGVVTQRYIDPGQTVVSAMQATPLFEIASDLRRMKAEVGVDEADIGAVREGLPATFTVSAWPDRVFSGDVSSVAIAPDPQQAVVTYDAEVRIDNADMALRPGMTATAEIQVGQLEDVWLVPSAALRYAPDEADPPAEPTLWLLNDRDPTPLAVTVLGHDATQTAVASEALTASSPVVIEGPAK